MHVILLDTEGSGSIEKNSTHDAKIFALVVLISSFFVYNSMGAIDENAINNLSLAAKLSTNIAVRANAGVSEDEVIANFTPKFLWLLRDFVLEMKEDGHKITENEYLESKINNHTEVKAALVKFFRMRELMTMVRPSKDEYQLANLNKVNFKDLRKEFQKKANSLKHKVFEECPLKQMSNKRISGKILARLLQLYVIAINDGAVPNITSAWESVVDHEREKYFNKAKSVYLSKIKRIELPLDEYKQLETLFEMRTEAFEILNKGFKLDDDNVDKQEEEIMSKELKLFIDQNEKDAKKSNEVISRRMCEEQIRSCFSSINLKLRHEGYTPENMDELELDVAEFTKAYNKQTVGPAKHTVFMDFMKTAIPKISKDVLSKEYKKQKENEDRLNQAIRILQDQKKMLEDNLNEVEREQGENQDILEDLESKLKKATRQEKMLLEKAEDEATKRQELMDALEDEKQKNDELKNKRIKAEKSLEVEQERWRKEERQKLRNDAVSANVSKEEASRIKEASRGDARKPRTARGVDLEDVELASKSDQDSSKGKTQRQNKPIKSRRRDKKVKEGKGG